jgi:hypothetical protein
MTTETILGVLGLIVSSGGAGFAIKAAYNSGRVVQWSKDHAASDDERHRDQNDRLKKLEEVIFPPIVIPGRPVEK